MKEIVISHIKNRFIVFNDLAESLTTAQYSMSLNVVKTKTVEEHFWCVIGARESYYKSLLAGEWQGFKCSLVDSATKADYIAAFKRTEGEFSAVIENIQWTANTEELLVSLQEHETMHEGQLIRLIYGLNLKMPASSQWA